MGVILGAVRSITVEPVLILFMFANVMNFSGLLAITYDKSCLLLYNATLCDVITSSAAYARGHKLEEDRVQSESSAWIMRGNICMAVPATFSMLLWLGNFGDRYGRRVPLALSCLSAIVYSISNVVNAVYMTWSPVFMLPGEVCSGLGGSFLAMEMAGYTYLTHLAERESRMVRLGFAQAAVFLAGTVSLFVSGRLVDNVGYVTVFSIVFFCQVLAFLYTLVLLPDIKPKPGESTDAEKRSQSICLNPVSDIRQFLTAVGARKVTGESDILLLYLKRAPRRWSYTTYGYFKGAENLTRGAILLLLLPALKKTTLLRDTTLVMAGLLSKVGGLVLLGLANTTPVIFAVVAVSCLQGFPCAGLRSIIASLVNTDEQGRLFGVMGATQSVVSFAATLIFNGLYPLTLPFYDGFCFQLAASLVFLCFLIVLVSGINTRTQTEQECVSPRTSSPDDRLMLLETVSLNEHSSAEREGNKEYRL